jgi:hypothetical protein
MGVMALAGSIAAAGAKKEKNRRQNTEQLFPLPAQVKLESLPGVSHVIAGVAA